MTTEKFEKCKKELEERKNKNDEQILINDERIRMSQVNKFEYKAGKITSLIFLFVSV